MIGSKAYDVGAYRLGAMLPRSFKSISHLIFDEDTDDEFVVGTFIYLSISFLKVEEGNQGKNFQDTCSMGNAGSHSLLPNDLLQIPHY